MAPERYVIGVDVGGTKVAAALVRGRLPEPGARTPAEVETPEILDRFTMLTDVSFARRPALRGIEACIADLEHGSGAVEGIGIGVASMVDFAGGRVVESVNLPLTDVPLRDLLQQRFGGPRRHRQRRHGGRASASTCTAPAWARATCSCSRSGPAWAAASSAAAARCAARAGPPPRSATSSWTINGLKCPANCPNWGCLEAYAAGPGHGRRRACGGRTRARVGAGAGSGGRPPGGQPAAHQAGARGRRRRDRGAGAHRRVPGRRARHALQHLRPGARSSSAAARRRRATCSSSRPAASSPPAPCRRRATACASCRRRSVRTPASSARRRSRSPSSSLGDRGGVRAASAGWTLRFDFAARMPVNGRWKLARTASAARLQEVTPPHGP